MTKPERIAAIQDAIAAVEREECHCWLCPWCLDNNAACEECGGTGIDHKCGRCEHLEDLDAQLQEAEGA